MLYITEEEKHNLNTSKKEGNKSRHIKMEVLLQSVFHNDLNCEEQNCTTKDFVLLNCKYNLISTKFC